jgi:hypothetical protein
LRTDRLPAIARKTAPQGRIAFKNSTGTGSCDGSQSPSDLRRVPGGLCEPKSHEQLNFASVLFDPKFAWKLLQNKANFGSGTLDWRAISFKLLFDATRTGPAGMVRGVDRGRGTLGARESLRLKQGVFIHGH